MQQRVAQLLHSHFIDSWITQAMEQFHVPGLVFGITSSQKTLEMRSYGYRDISQNLPIDSKTLMAVASNSKSFTGLMMGMLVDQKKLSWDDPVRYHLPEWQMFDPQASQEIKVRDLLLHCSGLPRYDLAWLFKKSLDEVVHTLKDLPANHPFAHKFQYQNLMYAAASYVQERVTQTPWHKLIHQYILQPLGMDHSSALSHDLLRYENHARPHMYEGGHIITVAHRDISHVAGAGSIVSNLEDMLAYVRSRLNLCQTPSPALLSPETARYLQQAHIEVGDYFGGKIDGSYGMGVFVKTLYGHRLVHHTGSIDGFLSAMCWLPDDDLGMVILTNSGTHDIASMIEKTILDHLLQVPHPTNWMQQALVDVEKEEQTNQQTYTNIQNTKQKNSPPSFPLKAYTGRYHHPAYGILLIQEQDQQLTLNLGDFHLPLEHIHDDVFCTPFDPGGLFSWVVRLTWVQFFQEQKNITALSIALEPSMPPLVFQRQP